MRYFFLLINLISISAFAQRSTLVQRLKTTPDNEKIKLYIAISEAYTASEPDSAVHFANEGIRLSDKLNDQHGQGLLLLQLGRVNTIHNHHDLARKFFNESLGIFRRLQDAEGIAHAYDELGLLEGREQHVSVATKDLNQARKFYLDSRDSSGIIETYESMGRVYEEKGDMEKAISYYLRALTQYEHRNQKTEAYFVLLENVGNLYLKKGDSSSAKHYLQEGIKNSNSKRGINQQVSLLNEEGKVFEQEHNQSKALGIYKQALSEAKKYKQPEEQAMALINIAGLLKKQNATASLEDLKQALTLAQNMHEPKLEATIYEALSSVYQQEKNYREAMAALEEQHRLLDSLLKADTAKDIAALDSSYSLETSREKIGGLQQIERTEKTEIRLAVIILIAVLTILVLLWFYLRKVKRLNEELTNSNRVKDTLFSVIGHDLKGPAGSAAQLFEMLETEEFGEDELRGMIGELRKQTTASLELLQALFEWGKAQLQGIKVKPVDFDPLPVVDRCVSLLSQQAAGKQITINNSVAHLRVHADADHFEFVIRNLLSNAIKFTYQGGMIELNGKLPDSRKEVVFTVRDSGIGISKEQQKVFLSGNMKVSFGTGKEKGSGLGLLLAKDFIKANRGRIWLESEEGRGTTFYIALPAA